MTEDPGDAGLDAQVATLLRSATSDLDHDVTALVGAGMARGRRTRRRRRVGTGLAAVVLLVAAGGGLAATLGGGETRRAIDPVAEPTTSVTASPSPTPAPSPPPGPRSLAVTGDEVARTLADVLPGDVALAPVKTGEQNPDVDYGSTSVPPLEPGPGINAELTWNGARVTLTLTGSTPVARGVVDGGTAMDRCLAAAANGTCEPTADGGALLTDVFDTDKAGAQQYRTATLWTPDLWMLTAFAVQDQGGPVAPTLDELVAVVSSDVWLD